MRTLLVPTSTRKRILTEDSERSIIIGNYKDDDYVLAYKISNVGKNSKFTFDHEGTNESIFPFAPEVAKGVDFPYCLTAEIKFKFSEQQLVDGDTEVIHRVIVEETFVANTAILENFIEKLLCL